MWRVETPARDDEASARYKHQTSSSSRWFQLHNTTHHHHRRIWRRCVVLMLILPAPNHPLTQPVGCLSDLSISRAAQCFKYKNIHCCRQRTTHHHHHLLQPTPALETQTPADTDSKVGHPYRMERHVEHITTRWWWRVRVCSGRWWDQAVQLAPVHTARRHWHPSTSRRTINKLTCYTRVNALTNCWHEALWTVRYKCHYQRRPPTYIYTYTDTRTEERRGSFIIEYMSQTNALNYDRLSVDVLFLTEDYQLHMQQYGSGELRC